MNKDNVEGKLDQISGKVKESVGKAIGDNEMVASGVKDQAKGTVKETWGNVKDGAASVRDHAEARAYEDDRDVSASGTGPTLGDKIAATARSVRNTVNQELDENKKRDRY